MITMTLVIGLVSVALLVACATAQPAGDRGRERSAARRRKFVEHNPTHVNSQDIRLQLVRDGVAVSQASFITEKAADDGIKPFTMWLWLQQFDAEALGIVVAADVTHRDLLTHISNGTVPDLEELKLFASANGLSIAGPPVRTARRKVLVDSGLTAPRRMPLPPIYEPGEWPGTPSDSLPRLGEKGLAA
ncbi:hypothetical protein [Nocardioides sp.]|uniref:hypothetical protein n=1 Tax=Nocardioides sp. TaxID=35761 RepID=UPI00272552C5|nr:hypothetical protein [Nocardioides sp.]MDO9457948.1 hypothetical protein [Nocardioides sp.]